MMDKALQELIEFIKSASPVIWQAFYRQVYVEALGFLLGAIGAVALAIVLFRIANWARSKKDEDNYGDWELLYGFSYFFSGVAGIVAFFMFISAIKWVANPEFYAIRFILQSLGN